MKRRQFLQNIGAAGAVTAMPSVAVSSGTAVSAAVYERAVYYTRLWGTSVPEMYTSALGLDLTQAQHLFGQLVRDRVIAAPNASGIASATSPFFKASLVTKSVATETGKAGASSVERRAIRIDSILETNEDDEAESLVQDVAEDETAPDESRRGLKD